ncbi:MAG TPA: tetratricopeptide repeat protein [Thermomonas sp.]|uniref:tetratricopeptide repeat protein n=1 Tax=Thermomonas sp. TaxID=1971895 RepID=UPI002C47CCA1|nr:tetratricopeptide repeat protein [Thermomonas sp.]HOV96325.1 tetratricopeptide repeat protein [Thermomonas sp.]
MTQIPREPLSHEERVLAAQLPKLHGRNAPDAALDARILRAAHAAALRPSAPARRRRWATPLALAASLCLALGLAWRVQLQPTAPIASPTPSPQSTAPASSPPAATQPAAAASVPSPNSTASPPPAAVDKPSPRVRQSPPPPPEDPPVVLQTPRAFVQEAPTPPPPAPPPPAPAPATATVAEQARDADANVARRPAAQLKTLQAAPSPDTAADTPLDDVPPATMASPSARDAWLRRIRQLQQLGKTDEARASLAEFRHRYPQANLPADLRGLEPTSSDPASH